MKTSDSEYKFKKRKSTDSTLINEKYTKYINTYYFAKFRFNEIICAYNRSTPQIYRKNIINKDFYMKRKKELMKSLHPLVLLVIE